MTDTLISSVVDFDDILNEALLEAAISSGRNVGQIMRQFGTVATIATGERRKPSRPPMSANVWTADDQAYLAEWAGLLSDAELGERLGRTAMAVKIRRTRAGYPSPTTHEDYLTAYNVSQKLGVCVKAVCKWIERGYIKADLAPLADRQVWRMRRTYFYPWALNPNNWILFYRSVRYPERIRDAKLRQLIVRRAQQWGDEWLTPGEVAALHHVSEKNVNLYIHSGKLQAVKWNNWMIRRSDAMNPNLTFYKEKGGSAFDRNSTGRRDAFIVLATAVGLPFAQVSNMMSRDGNCSHNAVYVRHENITRHGLIPEIIERYGLPVRYRAADGATWADWRTCGRRFTLVEQAWDKWLRGELMTRYERFALGGVLRSAVAWVEGANSPLAHGISRGMPSDVLLRKAMDVYQILSDEVEYETRRNA